MTSDRSPFQIFSDNASFHAQCLRLNLKIRAGMDKKLAKLSERKNTIWKVEIKGIVYIERL